MPRIIPIRDLKTLPLSPRCAVNPKNLSISPKWLWRYGHYEHGSL